MSKITTKQSNLPTLEELVKDVGIYEKQDKLNFLLNQEPPTKWVKEHPYVRGHKYLPIDKTEYLLKKIFKSYKIEVLREGSSFNGVYVVVRVWYKNPVTSEWAHHDGIGAIHLQTKKGSSPADLNNINNGALSMSYPLAKTLAVKDACDHLGKLFGSDLNRKDTLPASMDAPRLSPEEKLLEINELLERDDLTITEDDRLDIQRITEEKETVSYDKVIKLLKSKLPK